MVAEAYPTEILPFEKIKALGDEAIELFGPALLLVLTAVLWYFRPADRIPINIGTVINKWI